MLNVIVLTGPTASGKTVLGIELALALNGEIVSADARQIYRYMDVGTAKPTLAEQAKVKHHLIDIVNPDESYNAGQFARDAALVINDIHRRGKLPIVVGGAGLYLKALFDGFSPVPEIPESIRQHLQQDAQKSLPALYHRLQKTDPDWAQKIQPADTQRIIRGLEIFEVSGKTFTHFQNQPRQTVGTWQTKWFGLHWVREALYDRINHRALRMVDQGIIAEVTGLMEMGYHANLDSLNTFGYKEFIKFLQGKTTIEAAIGDLQQNTRRYAKRQITWFRTEKRLTWIPFIGENPLEDILHKIERP